MSIVRHKDKKSGSIIVYESTSHYDPETKQSRPIRKYLGIEDPVTGELIPSSGKRGRKKKVEGEEPTAVETAKGEGKYKAMYEKLLTESTQQKEYIKQLEHENKRLTFCLLKLRDTIAGMIEGK